MSPESKSKGAGGIGINIVDDGDDTPASADRSALEGRVVLVGEPQRWRHGRRGGADAGGSTETNKLAQP